MFSCDFYEILPFYIEHLRMLINDPKFHAVASLTLTFTFPT